MHSVRNKFDMLDEIVKAFGICLISESKLDNTFPEQSLPDESDNEFDHGSGND